MSLSSHTDMNIEGDASKLESTAHDVSIVFKADWNKAKEKVYKEQTAFIKDYNLKSNYGLFKNGMAILSEWKIVLLEAETCSTDVSIQEAKRGWLDKAVYCMDNTPKEREGILNGMRRMYVGYEYLCTNRYIEYLQDEFSDDNNSKEKLVKWENELNKFEILVENRLKDEEGKAEEEKSSTENKLVDKNKKKNEKYFTENELIIKPEENIKTLRAAYDAAKADYTKRNSCLTKLSFCCNWNKKPKPESNQSTYAPPPVRMP